MNWHLLNNGWIAGIFLAGHLIIYGVYFYSTIRDVSLNSSDVSSRFTFILVWTIFLILHFSAYFYQRGRDYVVTEERVAYRNGFSDGMKHAEQRGLAQSLDQLMVGADGEIMEKQKQKQPPKHSRSRRRF